MSAVEIETAVQAYNREPFQELLVLLLEAAPTCDEIQAFANKYPDRWARAIVLLAGLAGYSPQVVINATASLHMDKLSDAELLARLAETESQLQSFKFSA